MDFVWISGPRGIEGMAVQEYEGRGYDDETGHGLSIFNIDNMTSDAATIVARDSFMKLFDAAAGPDGSISVVYGEPRGEQTIAITHRVAIPCSRPTSSGARRAPRR